MHPSLLDPCFIPLFNNAIEAILRAHGPRTIHLTARPSADQPGYIEVLIRNAGEPYPQTILATQGRVPIESRHGLGVGLVLARRSLELVGGSIRFANERGHACATPLIPGHEA